MTIAPGNIGRAGVLGLGRPGPRIQTLAVSPLTILGDDLIDWWTADPPICSPSSRAQ